MKIWLIEREHCSYDETGSVVVTAKTEEEALKEAGNARGDQSPSEWYLPSTKITELGTAKRGRKPRIEHESYNAG